VNQLPTALISMYSILCNYSISFSQREWNT
jgi:hypothetical protein